MLNFWAYSKHDVIARSRDFSYTSSCQPYVVYFPSSFYRNRRFNSWDIRPETGVLNRYWKIGKCDLIDFDCIDQSVEIDDTIVSFIDLYWKIHLFTKRWKTAKLYYWQLSCNWESKDRNIYRCIVYQTFITFKWIFKKSSYLLFKTRFKLFFWLILVMFVGAQIFRIFISHPFKITLV